jgi:PPOX class probable FMN-dependent enzyme
MTEAETPVWREQLKRAIRENRRDAHNRYLQFATLGLDGKPRVRMVVFRGFSPSEASFFIITDARSEKVKELAHCPDVEVSWYFTQTREQFRLRCGTVVHSHNADVELHRDALWKGLSEAAKAQFFWPEPGLSSGEGQSLEITAHPPETFVVIQCRPQRVDHLVLAKTQRRMLSDLTSSGWTEVSVNP